MRTLILALLFAAALAAAPLFPLPPANAGTLELNVCDLRQLVCLPQTYEIADYTTDVKWRASVVEISTTTPAGQKRIVILPLSRVAEANFYPKPAAAR